MKHTILARLTLTAIATAAVAHAQNDECATATIIATSVPTPFNTITATPSPVPWACTASAPKDVWFTFNAAASYTAFASTCNMANYDTRIEVEEASWVMRHSWRSSPTVRWARSSRRRFKAR